MMMTIWFGHGGSEFLNFATGLENKNHSLPTIPTTISSQGQRAEGANLDYGRVWANRCPNVPVHIRIASELRSIVLWAMRSSTSRKLRVKRKYTQTSRGMISLAEPTAGQ